MTDIDAELQSLLAEHGDCLALSAETGKVVCKLSGHSMPPRAPVVLQYLRYAGCGGRRLLS